MTEQKSSFGILGRLTALAATLLTLASPPAMGASLDHGFSAPPSWVASDAAVTVVDAESTRLRAAELALAEVRITRSILQLPELVRERGYREFVGSVETALRNYELSARSAHETLALATSLAIARNLFGDQISSLAVWASFARSSVPCDERYIAIPDRFVASERISIVREKAPTAADFGAIFEFDQV